MAELILRDRRDDHVAIYFARETSGNIRQITWGDLRERVRQLRSALVNSGVRQGDVVAAVISNSVHAIVIALATLSIGAVWSSTSCDIGVAGIVERYSQVTPKIVFADDGYVYAGKIVCLEDRIRQWAADLKQHSGKLADIVIIPSCDLGLDAKAVAGGYAFEGFVSRDTGDSLTFDMVPFSHPAFILYSSGTVCLPREESLGDFANEAQ